MHHVRSRVGIRQHVNYKCYGPDGRLKWEHDTPKNTLTELMDVLVADRLSGGTDTLMTHAHLGTGSGATSASTNLTTPCTENRTAVDSTTQGTAGADNDVVIVTTFPAGVCTASIEEAGMFSSITYTDADMKAYDDTISKVKAAADSLVLTWTFTFGAS